MARDIEDDFIEDDTIVAAGDGYIKSMRWGQATLVFPDENGEETTDRLSLSFDQLRNAWSAGCSFTIVHHDDGRMVFEWHDTGIDGGYVSHQLGPS